jgi:single-strand DNA-binding protein
LNTVSLIGRLTRDPELRTTNGGQPVCNMRIAVEAFGSDNTLYIDVTSFGESAKACGEHLERGRTVGVAGRLVYEEWQVRDGSKRSRHKIIGRVHFLPSGWVSPGGSEAVRVEAIAGADPAADATGSEPVADLAVAA